ncbi:unnamed protein product [Sympodiomycopsis kandeliae]
MGTQSLPQPTAAPHTSLDQRTRSTHQPRSSSNSPILRSLTFRNLSLRSRKQSINEALPQVITPLTAPSDNLPSIVEHRPETQIPSSNPRTLSSNRHSHLPRQKQQQQQQPKKHDPSSSLDSSVHRSSNRRILSQGPSTVLSVISESAPKQHSTSLETHFQRYSKSQTSLPTTNATTSSSSSSQDQSLAEMKRLLNRSNKDSHGDGNRENALRSGTRRFAKSTVDLSSDRDGYFSGAESPSSSRKSASYVRKGYNDKSDGYLGSNEEKSAHGIRSLGRKFFKPSSAAVNNSSPYSWLSPGAARQGSQSSQSTLQSSPPHTPTTPHSPAGALGASKDHFFLNGLPQLPPLTSLGSVASKEPISVDNIGPPVTSSASLASGIHTSHVNGSSLAPKKPLTIAVPAPARTSSIIKDPSPRVTIAPLASPSKAHTPTVSSPLATTFSNVSPQQESPRAVSPLPTSSSFDETSDFLAAVLNFGENGIGNASSYDDTPVAARSPTPQSSSFSTTSSSFGSFAYQGTGSAFDSSRTLPRRLTEAQLAQLEQEDRQKRTSPPRSTYGRSNMTPSYSARPGLFSTSTRRRQDSDSEDEYGDADAAESDDDEDWDAAKKSEPTSQVNGKAKGPSLAKDQPSEFSTSDKLTPGRKSSDFMSRASAFLKSRTSNAALSPTASPLASPITSELPTGNSPSAFPSSFARQKRNVAGSPDPTQNERSRSTTPTPLPGLNSPAKRALYACTLLKVHPQLDSILKVGVSAAADFGEIPGSVEIRFPRSINSVKKLDAASKFGGSQLGVAGAPITLGSRRLDVALAQTKVMRKLRRRLTRDDEVEIGWFLKGYASEIISPETIAKSLAAKPQVSPEALARPLISSQEGEKIPLRSASANARTSVDSISPTTPGEAKDAARKVGPNGGNEGTGLARWVMRKPFLERCAMIRGEDEDAFNVGDVVVDTEHAATAISAVSADTFRVGDIVHPKRQSAVPATAGQRAMPTARPGTVELSPRIRVLAGFSPRPEPSPVKKPIKRSQTAAVPKAPAPWSARRQTSLDAPQSSSSQGVSRSQAAHLQAAHDKLTGKSDKVAAVGSAKLQQSLSPAQALAVQTRVDMQSSRRGSADSVLTGSSPFHSPQLSSRGLDADSNEASGGEYYSAFESEEDDDKPISTLAFRRRSSAVGAGDREAADSSSVTIKADDSPKTTRAVSPRPEEQDRIIALEQELASLKRREQYRESMLSIERAQLNKLRIEQEAARKLEEQKRQLKQARERRSRTEHSDVLTSHTYGAGSSLARHENASARRLKHSSSMADVTPTAAPATEVLTAHTQLSSRRSSQNLGGRSPLLGASPSASRLSVVAEKPTIAPGTNALSPPAHPDQSSRRNSALNPPVAASARASAALTSTNKKALPTQNGGIPASPSQQPSREHSARRLSYGSSAGNQPSELPRSSSRNNLQAAYSMSPVTGGGLSPGYVQRSLSPSPVSPKQQPLSSRPSLSALPHRHQQVSPRLAGGEFHGGHPTSPGRSNSGPFDGPAGATKLGPGYSPQQAQTHQEHLQQLHQQQQWQQFQQWQQMQYQQSQHMQYQQAQQAQMRQYNMGAMPHSATFGGYMGSPQPLVRLSHADIPSSARSARSEYGEV